MVDFIDGVIVFYYNKETMDKYENHNTEYSKDAQNKNAALGFVVIIVFLVLGLAALFSLREKDLIINENTNKKINNNQLNNSQITQKIKNNQNDSSVLVKEKNNIVSRELVSQSKTHENLTSGSIETKNKNDKKSVRVAVKDFTNRLLGKDQNSKKIDNTITKPDVLKPKTIKPPLIISSITIFPYDLSHLRCRPNPMVPVDFEFISEMQSVDGERCLTYLLKAGQKANAEGKNEPLPCAYVRPLPEKNGLEILTIKDKKLLWTLFEMDDGIRFFDNTNNDNYVIRKEDKKYVVFKNDEEYSEVIESDINRLFVYKKDNKKEPFAFSNYSFEENKENQLYYSLLVWSFSKVDLGVASVLYLESLKYELNNNKFDFSEN